MKQTSSAKASGHGLDVRLLTADDALWFARRLEPVSSSGCRLWRGGTTGRGYGALHLRGCWIGARTLAWMLKHGKRPNKRLMSTCGNRKCCEVSHLRLASASEIATARAHRLRVENLSNTKTKE